MADEDDDLFDSVNNMADRIGLEGKDRERYVHEHMTRGGYRAVPQYVRDEERDEEDRDSGGFFGRGRDRGRDRGDDRRPRGDRGGRRDSWYDQ